MSVMLISMSRWRWRRAKEVSRSLPIVDLSDDLMRLRPLKDRSAEQEVTGRVQSMSSRTLMFGKRDDTCGKVKEGVVGREECPCSSSCCFHLRCQQ